MSGLSVNTPSTPSAKNCRISALRSPGSAATSDERSSRGRNCSRAGTCTGGPAAPRGARRARTSSAAASTRRRRAGRCSPSTGRRPRRSGRCRAGRPASRARRRCARRRGSPWSCVEQLHERHLQHRVQRAQVAGLEGLDEHRRAAVVEPVAVERRARAPARAAGRSSGSRSGAWSPGRRRAAGGACATAARAGRAPPRRSGSRTGRRTACCADAGPGGAPWRAAS